VKKKRIQIRNVVPRSAFKIATGDDDEFVLYRVIILKKGVELYKNLCRDKRYTLRHYKHDPEEEKSQQDKKIQIQTQYKKLWAHLVRWCSTQYSDVFHAWIHVKAMRLFVESVLRYGLPVDFTAILIKPVKGNEKKLRAILNESYRTLAGSNVTDSSESSGETDISGVGPEFYPYVYLTIVVQEAFIPGG